MKRAAEKAKGNDLFQMLQDKEVQEKEARIQQMIDQELDKPDDQVDFERIEACVKALHTMSSRCPWKGTSPCCLNRAERARGFGRWAWHPA